MAEPLTPDICIIGTGPGALALASAATALRARVVLVAEPGDEGAPTRRETVVQALAAAGRHAAAIRAAPAFGIAAAEPEVDFRALMRHVGDAAAAAAVNAAPERVAALGALVVRGEARFRDGRTLLAGRTEIRARRFVLAVRSVPVPPPLAGVDAVERLTEDTVPELRRRPGHLVVLGGGGQAATLAQAFRRLGSEATLVAPGPALPGHDPELAAVVLRRLAAEGVAVVEHAATGRVERRGKTGIRLSADTPAGPFVTEATHLLVAGTRVPATEGLALDKAGVTLADGGGVTVDAALRSANRRILVVGEAVAGVPASPGLADRQALLVVERLLLGRRARPDLPVAAAVALTDPELVRLGLTEAEALAAGKPVRILRWPYAENDRARAERRTEGHIKLIAGAKGEILGVSIAGAAAGELIAPWALAMAKGLGVTDMAALVPPHPTLGEIGKDAAISYLAGLAQGQRPGWLARAFRILG